MVLGSRTVHLQQCREWSWGAAISAVVAAVAVATPYGWGSSRKHGVLFQSGRAAGDFTCVEHR